MTSAPPPHAVLVFLLAARPGRSRYLLLHRRARPELGAPAHWASVSGPGLSGETPLDTARRIVLRETGLVSRTLADTGETHPLQVPAPAPVADARRDASPSAAAEIAEHLLVAWIDPAAQPRLSAAHDVWRWCDETEAAALLTHGHAAAGLLAIERHLDDFQI